VNEKNGQSFAFKIQVLEFDIANIDELAFKGFICIVLSWYLLYSNEYEKITSQIMAILAA
jgi:hypothetical protein